MRRFYEDRHTEAVGVQALSEKGEDMPEEHNKPSGQTVPETDVVEVVFRSDGTELTPEEINALKERLSNGPGINPFRRHICLSVAYRSSLYDRLAAMQPEVFGALEDSNWQQKNATRMYDFLREQLRNDRIEVNEDILGMLWLDFVGSREFYLRRVAQK